MPHRKAVHPLKKTGEWQTMRHKTGCGITPDGWLCITINALAAVIIATRKISRGCTKMVSIVPMEII